jgi:CheY-like chemotaxis protein
MIGRTPVNFGRYTMLTLAAMLAMACCFTSSSARAADDNTAQIEKLFREGVDLYQQGKYSESQRKLRDVLALDPRKDLAARLVDEAGTRVMAKMMADVRMGNEPTYIWQLYRKFYVQKLADKDRMAKMATRLVDVATSEDERALLYREFAELGHYAIPVLAPYMRDANKEDYRTYSRIAIARMGSRAILPLIQLASHKDLLARETAILTISDIQPLDPRAIAVIKSRIEDPNEAPTVKAAATRVLQKITGIAADQSKSASEYYYDLANRYYLDRAGVAEEAEDVDGMIWHLNDAGDLVAVQYPLWAWNEQMAEDVTLKGLSVSPDYTAFFPLWASIHAEQYTEVKDLLDIVNENPSRHSFSAEEKKDIENWDKKLVNARRLAAAVGKEHVNLALTKVLSDLRKYPAHERLPVIGAFLAKELAFLDPTGELLTPVPEVVLNVRPGQAPVLVSVANAPVSVATDNAIVRITAKPSSIEVQALPNNEKPGKNNKHNDEAVATNEPITAAPAVSSSALVNGLECADETIQYACALALSQINRFPNKWIGSEKVAKILGRGVSEDKALQILVVEENSNKSNEMRQRLQDLGYGVTTAISARDAIVQAKSFPPKDIAIVSENLRRDLTAEQLLEEFRADVRTRYLPAGVLHVRNDQTVIKSRFGTDLPLVERESTGNDLKTQVEAIAAKRASESVPKRKAHEIAVACANALAKLVPPSTFILVDDAVENAIGALVNRPDDVRNPAAIFLGNTEGGAKKKEAADALRRVFEDGANVVELRRNALRSIGSVQKEGLEDLYLKAQADADQEIKDIGAESYGRISRANASVYNFIKSQRIDKDAKEK